jgi:hypothetical protein
MKFLDAPVTGAVAPRPVNVDGESKFRILEAYKVWLHREHEELSRDLYPDVAEPLTHFNPDTAAENFHYAAPGSPPPPRPGVRARQVLEAVGVIASHRIPADPDPVLSAIEAHRTAVARHEAALLDHRRLMQTLSGERPRSISPARETIAGTEPPEWAESERTVKATFDDTQKCAIDMLHRPPTTMAGAIALLRYMEELEVGECPMPKDLTDDRKTAAGRNRGQAYGWTFHAQRMIADALYVMADARTCPEGYTPVMRPDGAIAFLSSRAFAELSVASRAEIVVINPETCFDRPPREPVRWKQSKAA